MLLAFAQFHETHNNTELHLVGDGEERAVLEQQAHSLGIADHTRFLGFRDDRLMLLKQFDVFAMTSSLEGVPRCLMEAMAMGVPLSAFHIAGVDQLIEPELTGLSCPFGDTSGLARCWESLYRSPDLRESLVKNAAIKVANQFSAERMAREYAELFYRVCEKNTESKLKTVANQRKINFLLSIDTEEEWDWEGPFPEKIISMENIKMIPDFQYFLNKLGVRPSYFIDYAVADDPVACQILQDVFRDNPQAEVCAHLHPWVNPPVVPVTTEAMSHIVNLPIETVEQQLIQLTNKLECCFQYRPVSFRSGRWGINGNILRVLARLGYRVDSSVCPYYETEHFSCSKNSSAVYWPDYTFVDKPGTQRDILEIPVGAGFNRVNFQWVNRLHVQLQKKPWCYVHPIGILWQTRLLRKLYLSPELSSEADLLSLV
ncbi:MAG: glycosyltransferase, partial [Gammaproteobacteria bacterium]